MVEQPLELFLQRLSALTPEVSFLLAIVTMVVSSFSVICHPDGGCIDLSVEGQLHIISVLRVIVIINVRRDVVLFGFNSRAGSTCVAWMVMLGPLLSCRQ